MVKTYIKWLNNNIFLSKTKNCKWIKLTSIKNISESNYLQLLGENIFLVSNFRGYIFITNGKNKHKLTKMSQVYFWQNPRVLANSILYFSKIFKNHIIYNVERKCSSLSDFWGCILLLQIIKSCLNNFKHTKKLQKYRFLTETKDVNRRKLQSLIFVWLK